ncbi:MAG: transglycosylase domain-containing protein [Lachnospiraceae bacterium]|nr:transglycosylase domain-containing protein [Lachnospiraceae bacterium]
MDESGGSRITEKKNSWRSFGRSFRRLPWKKIGIGLGAAVAAFLLIFAVIIWRLIAAAPSIDSIDVSPSGSATWICDEEGNLLRKLSLSDSNRDLVSLEEIPDSLQNAVIAIEDSRFYEHHGVDPRGIARAFLKGITSGSFSEGASTITQQLIKNNVFTDWTQENSFADRFARKVQEQYLAVQLEKQLTKEEILEDYLNTINFGSGCYGVEAAAQRYFGKDVSALTLSESAVLAAIPQNPSGYNPIDFPEANQTRQRMVLRYMEEQGYITHEERMEAQEDDVYLRISTHNESYETESVYTYYEDALIDQVVEMLMSELNYSYDQATQALYSGGLRIYSAQDAAIQQICDEEFQNLANFPEGTQYGVDYSLTIQESDGTTTVYGSNALRMYIREYVNESFDLLCETQTEAQEYADAFREYVLGADAEAAYGSESVISSFSDFGADKAAVTVISGVTSGDTDVSIVSTADSDNVIITVVADSESSHTSAASDALSSSAAGSTISDTESNTTVVSAVSASASTETEMSGRSVLSERLTLSPQPQASLVIIEQETGFVRAIVGGRGEKTASLTLNRATDTTRQPGSTFKILTAYAPALDVGGQTLATLYENEPFTYTDGTAVSNWDITDYSGTVTIREAITRSINVVAVRCITEITPRLGFTYAESFGISTLVDDWESDDGSTDVIQPLALGGITNGVTNLELCAAYASIANGGMYGTPLFFIKILDRNGNVLLDASGRSAATNAGATDAEDAAAASSVTDDTASFASFTRVLQETTAFLLTSAMEDVITSREGTAYGTISAASQPVAGKTGTTSSYKDIWFVGYTPYYTCSVWGGYDNNQSLPDGTLWHSYSRSIWSAVMDRIHQSLPAVSFAQPDEIVEVALCSETHLLAQDSCPDTYTEYFADGTQPEDVCTEHESETPAEKETESAANEALESETEEGIIYQDLLDQMLQESESESMTENDETSDNDIVDNTTGGNAAGTGEPMDGSENNPADGNVNASVNNNETDSADEGINGPVTENEDGSANNNEADSSDGNVNGSAKDNVDGSVNDRSEETDSGDDNSDSNSPDTQGETSSLDDLMNRLVDSGLSLP